MSAYLVYLHWLEENRRALRPDAQKSETFAIAPVCGLFSTRISTVGPGPKLRLAAGFACFSPRRSTPDLQGSAVASLAALVAKQSRVALWWPHSRMNSWTRRAAD